MNIMIVNPHTGKVEQIATGTPAMNGVSDQRGYPDLDEQVLGVTATATLATGDSRTVKSELFMGAEYNDLIYGGELVPPSILRGCETQLAAPVDNDDTSLTITVDKVQWPGRESENILKASTPYLLMHQRPSIGVSPFTSGTINGFLAPNAEIIVVGAGYTGGTTVPVARTWNGQARYAGAYIQPIPGAFVPFNPGSEGIVVPVERPKILTVGVPTSPVANTLRVYFLASTEAANVITSGVAGNVVGYGVWVFPKTGVYLNNLNAGIPNNAQPSQYDNSGQQNAIYALASAQVAEEVVETVTYKRISGLNRCWNPATCQLETLTTGQQYWVVVRALTSLTLDYKCRMSAPAIALSPVVS